MRVQLRWTNPTKRVEVTTKDIIGSIDISNSIVLQLNNFIYFSKNWLKLNKKQQPLSRDFCHGTRNLNIVLCVLCDV